VNIYLDSQFLVRITITIIIILIIIIIINMLMPVKQNSFTHIRVLWVLTDRSISVQLQLVTVEVLSTLTKTQFKLQLL
jgi:hypothetical protein